MAEAPIVVIAHPGAGRGAFVRVWPEVARELEARGLGCDVRLTTRAMEAAEFARQAAVERVSLVLAHYCELLRRARVVLHRDQRAETRFAGPGP